MKRIGAIVVFKSGVTEEQAREALRKIKDLVDPTYYVGFEAPPINVYDDRFGGPTWYIP